ncbi:MAG: PliI family lysozyme inhibitor of I-type lysozyme [Desulfotignum sp.]
MKRLIPAVMVLLLPGLLLAGADRYVERYPLPDGRSAVVAEGDMEPRSMGSYSVRFYRKNSPDFPTDDFQDGIILSRDGFIQKATFADIDDDNLPDLVIFIRSAGSGGYLSADAISVHHDKPVVVARVTGLAPDADAIAVLRMEHKTSQKKNSL